MKRYTLKQRRIPLNSSYDVIVAGGGPAGCTAAAAAAREGAKTLLVEGTGSLGGMGTSGLVPAWMTFGDQEKMIIRGLAEKVYEASMKGTPHADAKALWGPIAAEHLKRVYDDLVTQAGASVLFNTALAAVERANGGAVAAVVLANKAGLTAFKAEVYVDCTGDGDLAAWAGARFMKGDDKTGELMPVTHCFTLSNVDEYGCRQSESLHPHIIRKILNSGRYPDIQDNFLCSTVVGPSTFGFNAGHQWDVDNTDPVTVSRALIRGRKMAAQFRDGLAEFCPRGFANAFLAATGSVIGARDTRRVLGDYVLTVEDFLARRSFPDEICRNHYPIDIHTSKKEVRKAREGKLNIMARYEHYKKGESHGIPYRCLTPKGLRNVLVAGRCVSCDRPVQGAIRVMSVCLGMGEAAGLAAALAAKAPKHDVHTVDTDRLRARLREEGGYLP